MIWPVIVAVWLAVYSTGATAATDFDNLLGNTCDPGDLRTGLHETWLMYCRGEERKAYDKLQSIGGSVPRNIWKDCVISTIKPKGASFIEMWNCLNRVLDSLPTSPPNTAVLSRGNFQEERFWTLAECQAAQKRDGGVCVTK